MPGSRFLTAVHLASSSAVGIVGFSSLVNSILHFSRVHLSGQYEVGTLALYGQVAVFGIMRWGLVRCLPPGGEATGFIVGVWGTLGRSAVASTHNEVWGYCP